MCNSWVYIVSPCINVTLFFSDPGRAVGYKKQLWSTEQSLTGRASNPKFFGLWSACGMCGSICYGQEDAVRKNNQGVFCINGGMALPVVAVESH